MKIIVCQYFNRKKFIENNFADEECRTYENLDALRMQVENTDSASLHFESILEGGVNHVDDMSGNESLFDIHRENYDIPRNNGNSAVQSTSQSYENTDANDDIQRKNCEFNYKYQNNELSKNALFNKLRELTNDESGSTSACKDLATNRISISEDIDEIDDSKVELTECKLEDSNSVSCEDLLEFANRKPKGQERGVESDEVRIMTKVLGANVSFLMNFCLIIEHLDQLIFLFLFRS